MLASLELFARLRGRQADGRDQSVEDLAKMARKDLMFESLVFSFAAAYEDLARLPAPVDPKLPAIMEEQSVGGKVLDLSLKQKVLAVPCVG